MAKFRKYNLENFHKRPKKEYVPTRKKQRDKHRKIKKWTIPEYEELQIKSPPKQTKSSTEKANDTLNYIQSNPNINKSNKLGMIIELAIKKELGDNKYELEKGVHPLYTIDNNWNGTTGSLVSHITFNKEFVNTDAQDYLDQLSSSEWGSKELHEKHLQKAASAAYAKNVGKLGDRVIPSYMNNTLEKIMNSSDMWHIVADQYGLGSRDYSSRKDRKSLMSEQAQQEWLDVHRKIDRLINSKISSSEIQQLQDIIFGYDKEQSLKGVSYDELKNFIDDMLEKYKK